MQFTPTYLKVAAQNDIKLGNWNDKTVYAISKSDIKDGNYSNSRVYVIYDDDNKLFYQGKIYGTVSKNGTINECRPYEYLHKTEIPVPVKETAKQTSYIPSVVGDVNLELEVEKMLNSVKTMTVNDLLKGFDYGLN